MAVTNPTKEEFVTWAQEKAEEQSEGFIEKGLVSFFGESHIENSTTDNDYLVLTVFKTKVNEDYTVITIGMFKNFLPIGY